MERYPFISAVMPTKNRRRFVAESIRRFLAQDWPGAAELVIVEDGDASCEDLAASAWAEWTDRRAEEPHGPRDIRYFRFAGSLGAKLNFAAEQSRGGIVANWDDDDWYAPERLRSQYEHMRLTGKPVIGLASALFWREGDSRGWEYHGNTWYAAGFSHLYRREWALAHPHPDVTAGEDVFYMETARDLGDLSVITGLDVMVARNHDANTCPREASEFRLGDLVAHGCDNWREVPLSRIQAVIGR